MELQTFALFLDLYKEKVEAVFRYHLLRGGDWTAALSLTADTFFSALDLYNPGKIARGTETIWLWKIAVGLQSRRNPRAEGLQYSGEAPPDQPQVSTFAQAAQVTSQWHSLPRQQRDLLALFFFGGLSPEEAGQVAGGKGDRIRELAMQHGSAALFDLAREVHLVGYFQQRLENALRERAPKLDKRRLTLGFPAFWQLFYRAGSVFTWALRLSVVGLLIYILATAWNSFQQSSGPLPGPAPTQEPAPKITETPEFLFNSLQDDLIVADQNDQLRLYSLAKGDYSLALSPSGFYPDKHLKPKFQPQLSPDGKWLALSRPLQEDTWLLSMDGKRQVRLSDQQVKVGWSPDSLTLVSIDPQQAGRVIQVDVQSAVSKPIFEDARAQVLGAVYSPRGDGIAVAFMEGNWLRLAMVSSDGKTNLDLASILPGTELSAAPFELYFTADGKEIWLPGLHSAVTVPGGDVRPLEAEPFSDQTGARNQLLGLTDVPPMTESSLLSPDGYKAAVILRRIDNNNPSILTIYDGPRLATQTWMTYYGQIDAITWATDSASLFIQRAGAEGPNILRIDAQSGKNVTLLEKARLIGSRSILRQMANRFAPRTNLVKGEGSFEFASNLRMAYLPGSQVSFLIPRGWRLWTQGDGNPNGSAIAANFSFADSLGWAALPPGYVMIGISQYEWNDSHPLINLAGTYPGASSDRATLKRITLDGYGAYRLDFLKEDQTREPVVFFRTSRGDVSIWILHGADHTNQYFEQFIQSIHINGSQPLSQAERLPDFLFP